MLLALSLIVCSLSTPVSVSIPALAVEATTPVEARGESPAERKGPAKHPWVKAGVGAWIEMEIVHREEVQMLYRDELVGLDDERFRLRTTNTLVGIDTDPFTVERDFDYAYMGFAHLTKGSKKLGTETVKVGNRSHACTVHERAWEDGQGPVTSRVWSAASLDAPVRFEFQDGENTARFTFTGRYEFQTVGKRRIRCLRYEGEIFQAGVKLGTGVQWRSDEVPGGIVRNESRLDSPEGVKTHLVRALDFGLPKDAERR